MVDDVEPDEGASGDDPAQEPGDGADESRKACP